MRLTEDQRQLAADNVGLVADVLKRLRRSVKGRRAIQALGGMQDAVQEGWYYLCYLTTAWEPARGRFSTLVYTALTRHLLGFVPQRYRSRSGETNRRPVFSLDRAASDDMAPLAAQVGERGYAAYRRSYPRPGDLPPGATYEAAPETRALVDRVLATLPEYHRRVLIAHFLHGRSVADIAREMGVSRSNVGDIIQRALRWARERAVPECA